MILDSQHIPFAIYIHGNCVSMHLLSSVFSKRFTKEPRGGLKVRDEEAGFLVLLRPNLHIMAFIQLLSKHKTILPVTATRLHKREGLEYHGCRGLTVHLGFSEILEQLNIKPGSTGVLYY